jgi:hypothetical protein
VPDYSALLATLVQYHHKLKLDSLLSEQEYFTYYRYVKLTAKEPIIPSRKHPGKFVKHLHLGKHGSEAHLEEMEKINRRDALGNHFPAETLRVACFPAGVRRWYRTQTIKRQIEGMLQYCPPHPTQYM